MTRADELRASLEESVAALRGAIDAAAPRWLEAPAAGEWPPRVVASHIVTALAVYTEWLAAALDKPQIDWPARLGEFTSPPVALDALESIFGWSRAVLDGLTDAALQSEVPEMGTSARSPNVEGLLRLAAGHLREHAAQIRSV
jgi:hypothetical protein